MTNFYVRKSGSDANAGTSAALAWATIGKALTGGMASGDTVYIGAGVYREAVVITITPTVTTSIIADVDGSHTGDAGEVRWSGYTTDDKSAGNATSTCRLNGKNFLSFQHLHFVGSNTANGTCVDGLTVTGSHDLTFTSCAFTNGSNPGTLEVKLAGPVDTASNYTFDGCWFGHSGNAGQLAFTLPTSTIADYDAVIVVKNCMFLGSNQAGGPVLNSSGGNSFRGGGVRVFNCGLTNAQCHTSTTTTSAIYPMIVSNCYICDVDTGSQPFLAATPGGLVEDYNLLYMTSARLGVSTGPFSVGTNAVGPAPLFHWGQEVVWGGQPRPYGTPLSGSPILGFGNVVLVVGRSPTVADDATVGTIAWTNPTNASVPDATNAVATAIPITTGASHYLKATGYSGFAGIPSDATIKSVRVELLVSASVGAAISCNSVKLVKAGVISGNDLASSNTTQFSTGLAAQSWGNTTDPLWGLTLTPADVQASNFGVVWSAKNTTGTVRDCNVDFIRIIVAYTTADGAGGVATDVLGASRPAGGGSTSYAVGALERGNTATVQSTTVHTPGGSAWQLSGPAYQDAYANVDATSVTVSVWARYDTAGQQPTVTIKAAPELGLNADTALTWNDPGANTWGQFTTTITPTAAGVIQLRLATTTGTGVAYFDDVTLS